MADFPLLLAAERRRARLTQTALAARAGLSQRHLSFLETGRSRPGWRGLSALITALGLGPADADRLLGAAGLAALRAALAWGDAALAPVRSIADRMLARHEPAPAYLLDRAGTVLRANAGLDRLLALSGRDLWAATGGRQPIGTRNLYDLSLHPDGLSGFMVDPDRVVPAIMQRLRRAADRDDAAAATLDRVRHYPAARRHAGRQAPSDHGVIAETYDVGGRRLAFIAVTASFGAADSAATAGIEIESLFAADAATEALLFAIAAKDPRAPV